MKMLFIGDVHAKSKYILPCVDLAIECLCRGYYEEANTAAYMLNTMLQDS